MSVFNQLFEELLKESETNTKLISKVDDLEKRLIDAEIRIGILMSTASSLMESCTKLAHTIVVDRMAIEEIYTNMMGESCEHEHEETSHEQEMSPEELEEFLKSLN